MHTFELIEKHGDGHEQVVFCRNKEAGLRAIIAIHNTALGPALGGTRMWPYKSEEEALIDVLRLSKGMTYKASVAGLNLGGGKAVIIGDPKTDKTEEMFRAFGAFVNSLGGAYITAEDVGTTEKEMEYIFMETPFVTGIPAAFGGSGDPSPYTAHGVFMAIKASAKIARKARKAAASFKASKLIKSYREDMKAKKSIREMVRMEREAKAKKAAEAQTK